MSTDLQFPTPAIPHRPYPPPSTPSTAARIHPSPAKSCVGSVERDCPSSTSSSITPTAAEHKLTIPTSPPPAPKRRRVEFPACKRRLEFFDSAHTKEVDDFFTARFAEIQSRKLLKRRFPCL